MHPVLFQIGGFTVYTYGFFTALAVGVSYGMARRRAPRFGFSPAEAGDLVFILFVAGVTGARFLYILQHLEAYRGRYWHAFNIQEGGLVWYGGFIAAALSGLLYGRTRGWPLLKWCDFLAPILAVGHAIGRIGCFFNGCCYGLPGVPVQLYESAALLFIAFFLFRVSGPRRRDGESFALYLLMYAAARFGLEFWRGDQTHFALFTLPQWTSLVLFAGALLLLGSICLKKNSK